MLIESVNWNGSNVWDWMPLLKQLLVEAICACIMCFYSKYVYHKFNIDK